jgi:hypothetical protein
MTPGLDAGEPALQVPDIADVPNPAGAFVVASVASTGKFAVEPAIPLAGHVWMAPRPLPPIELPKLSWIVPSAFAAALGGGSEFACPGNVGACVELGVAVALGITAIWAKHVPQLSEKIVAATRNKRRICASCAISD